MSLQDERDQQSTDSSNEEAPEKDDDKADQSLEAVPQDGLISEITLVNLSVHDKTDSIVEDRLTKDDGVLVDICVHLLEDR